MLDYRWSRNPPTCWRHVTPNWYRTHTVPCSIEPIPLCPYLDVERAFYKTSRKLNPGTRLIGISWCKVVKTLEIVWNLSNNFFYWQESWIRNSEYAGLWLGLVFGFLSPFFKIWDWKLSLSRMERRGGEGGWGGLILWKVYNNLKEGLHFHLIKCMRWKSIIS